MLLHCLVMTECLLLLLLLLLLLSGTAAPSQTRVFNVVWSARQPGPSSARTTPCLRAQVVGTDVPARVRARLLID